jgi:hypothetical protein
MRFSQDMQNEFEMPLLGELTFFLGLVEHSTHPKSICKIFSFWAPLFIFLSQSLYHGGMDFIYFMSLNLIIDHFLFGFDGLIFSLSNNA